MELLPFVDVSTGTKPEAAVIWLHGLGADGFDFEPVVRELNLPSNLPVRFILPHAPMLPVTINGGYMMPAWYDILSQEIERECDQEGVRRSADDVWNLVDMLIEEGVDESKIVLAGFSQGGAVVHRCAMDGRQIAGVVALSTYIANEEDPIVPPTFPIFMGHGSDDGIVPMELGERAIMRYNDWDCDAEFVDYPMEHSIHPRELVDIRNFLIKVLS